MWPSLDVTLVQLGSHPFLMRTPFGHEVARSARQRSSVSYRYDSFCKRCVFGDGDLLEWLLGLIFLFFFFFSIDCFFFFLLLFSLDVISCIQISFFYTHGAKMISSLASLELTSLGFLNFRKNKQALSEN